MRMAMARCRPELPVVGRMCTGKEVNTGWSRDGCFGVESTEGDVVTAGNGMMSKQVERFALF